MNLSMIILVGLFFVVAMIIAIQIFRSQLKRMETQYRAVKDGSLRNSRIEQIIQKMDQLGKTRYYRKTILNHAITFSLTLVAVLIIYNNLIIHRPISPINLFFTFLVTAIFFAVYGYYYAKTLWHAVH